MGQQNSVMGSPMGPIEAKAAKVSDYVKTAKPIAVQHDALPELSSSAAVKQKISNDPQVLWDVIFRAEGHASLEIAVTRFLTHGTVRQLLAFVAENNDLSKENLEDVRNRFIMRYMEGRELGETPDKIRNRLLADLIVHEIDPSGFRLGTVLKHWTNLIRRAEVTEDKDEVANRNWENDMRMFLHEYGLIRLIDCMEETAIKEPGVGEALSGLVETDARKNRIMYLPAPNRRATFNRTVAASIRKWLIIGDKLILPDLRSQVTATRRSWNGLSGEPHPATAEDSIQTIHEACEPDRSDPIDWHLIYQRCLRHADLFTVKDLIHNFLNFLSEEKRKPWMMASHWRWLDRGRRRTPVENLAAVIADVLTSSYRQRRGINQKWYPLPLNSPSMSRKERKLVEAAEAAKAAAAPPSTPPPQPRQGPPSVHIPSPVPPRSEMEIYLELSKVEELYEKKLKEFGTLEDDEEDDLLMDTIYYLLEDMHQLQEELEAAKEANAWKPHNCHLCGQWLADEPGEREHMRIKHPRKPGQGGKKDGKGPRGGGRSPPGPKKGGRKPPSSKSSSPSSKGDSPKDGRGKIRKSTKGQTGGSKQTRPASGTAATPPQDPIGLGIDLGGPSTVTVPSHPPAPPPLDPPPPPRKKPKRFRPGTHHLDAAEMEKLYNTPIEQGGIPRYGGQPHPPRQKSPSKSPSRVALKGTSNRPASRSPSKSPSGGVSKGTSNRPASRSPTKSPSRGALKGTSTRGASRSPTLSPGKGPSKGPSTKPGPKSPDKPPSSDGSSPKDPKPKPKPKIVKRAATKTPRPVGRPRSLSNPGSDVSSPRRTRSMSQGTEGRRSTSPREVMKRKRVSKAKSSSAGSTRPKRGRRAVQSVEIPPTVPEGDAEEQPDGNDGDGLRGGGESGSSGQSRKRKRDDRQERQSALTKFLRDERKSPAEAEQEKKKRRRK